VGGSTLPPWPCHWITSIKYYSADVKKTICNFLQATGSWDYSVRVWTVSKNEYIEPENRASQQNDGKEINSGTGLLSCLTGHTGNIHTVAFSRAEMLVNFNVIFILVTQ